MRHKGLVALFGIGVVSCGPDAATPDREESKIYAEAMCAAVQDCACFSPFESQAACESEYEHRFAELFDYGALAFDEGCFNEFLSSDELNECTSFEAPRTSCVVFRGDKQLGQACSGYYAHVQPFDVQECGEGLTCNFGRCTDDPSAFEGWREEGDVCFRDEVLTCPSLAPDGVLLYCGRDERCHRQALVGEPCDAPDGCAQLPESADDDQLGNYCAGLFDGLGVCTPRHALGEPCDPSDINVCADGWCDAATMVCVPRSGVASVCGLMHAPFMFQPEDGA